MGKDISIGNIPPEANSKGRLNQLPPAKQQESSADMELSEGPRKGEKDEFLPATYKTSRGTIRTDR